ncbi:MAG: cupin [Anaerolineae bacterium]|nr:cupin [Anaerolineae bacterium]
MAVVTFNQVSVTRWHGGQHPTLDNITRQMRVESLRPYVWSNTANYRYPVRSHGYDKTLYCVQGSLEVTFPKTKKRVVLRSGDRLDLPRGIRYSIIVGSTGAQCVEGSYL